MNNQIKILIVDDHELILNGIMRMLGPLAKYRIVGSASNGQEAIDKAMDIRPDVVFMDINMPILNGIEATRILTEKLPEVKVLALTQYEESVYVKQIMQAGGYGYLLKNSKKEEFIAAIDTVVNGQKYLTRKVADKLIEEMITEDPGDDESVNKEVSLTKREREIIIKIADDKSNQEIADELHISLRTVETHRRNLMQKLKVKTVVALLKYAAQHNIISFDK